MTNKILLFDISGENLIETKLKEFEKKVTSQLKVESELKVKKKDSEKLFQLCQVHGQNGVRVDRVKLGSWEWICITVDKNCTPVSRRELLKILDFYRPMVHHSLICREDSPNYIRHIQFVRDAILESRVPGSLSDFDSF
jgi:hypothetical protein